jgi:hypothetical protein
MRCSIYSIFQKKNIHKFVLQHSGGVSGFGMVRIVLFFGQRASGSALFMYLCCSLLVVRFFICFLKTDHVKWKMEMDYGN